MRDILYYDAWSKIAKQIVVEGRGLSASDLKAISDNLDFGHMSSVFLPVADLASKSTPKRRSAQFGFAKNLWGLDSEQWLSKEKEWLQNQRERVGLTLEEGKDGIEDVVCVALLCEIVAGAYMIYKIEAGEYGNHSFSIDFLIRTTVRSVNEVIENAVGKGYSRALRLETFKGQDTARALLISSGVRVGVTGKYLPDPENTLWQLLVILHKDSIREEVYK